MKNYSITSKAGLRLPNGDVVTELLLNGDGIEISDGYHTMSELYEHRIALFAALCNTMMEYVGGPWKSKLHSDGSMFEGGYFIAGIHLYPYNGEQITYHMKLKWWDKFKVDELERAPEYDGHTSADVIERLLKI